MFNGPYSSPPASPVNVTARVVDHAATAPAATNPTIAQILADRNRVVMANQPAGTDSDPFTWAEIERIVKLTTIRPMDEVELAAYNYTHVQAHAYQGGFRLKPEQAEAVAAYEIYGGMFGTLGVGQGKTLVSLMVASAAYSKGLDRGALFVPPEVYSQLIDVDIAWARMRVNINFPIHELGGKSLDYRRNMCKSGRKGLYIFPYSLLSTKDTTENLMNMDPQFVIADEGHRLANASAARTRRFMAMLERASTKGRPIELVILSGTITSKTINEYWHLIKPCLRNNCPLPLSASLKNDWAMLIDAEAASPDAPQSPNGTGPIMPLVAWAKREFPEAPGGFPQDVFGFRKAFKHRLNSAPGVVSSGSSDIGTSLILKNTPVEAHDQHPQWPTLKALCDMVTERWQTPNGDEIEHAIHMWKWLYELSAGFYNELSWPAVPDYAHRKRIPEAQAETILSAARIHHTAGQEYAKELRSFLLNESLPGLDTPFLVGQDMMRFQGAHVPATMYGLWKDWKDLDFEGRPDRDSRAVRICDYKVKAAVKWAQELRSKEGEGPHAGGILWVYHQELGKWQTEELRAAGITNVLHCPAGETYNEMIRDPQNKHCLVVASYKAHGTGKNLQHFHNPYFVQWPRRAAVAEQVLGRMHRTGQMADEIITVTNNTLLFDELNFAACLNDALYIHQSTGNRQKLIYANYEPLPKIFPPAVLMQKGLEVTRLDTEQETMFREKFGNYKGATQ